MTSCNVIKNASRWWFTYNFSGSGTVAASCQRCFDSQVLASFLALPTSCNAANFSPRDFCSDECAGVSCTYYRDDGYPADCRTDLAQFCTDAGVAAPTVCGPDSGPTQATGGSTSALVAVKEVAVLVLLVAVLWIL